MARRSTIAVDLEVLKKHDEKVCPRLAPFILTEERVREIVRDGKPGRYRDGNCLYILIPPGSQHSYWIYDYRVRGSKHKRRMSLGPTRLTTLAEARRVVVGLRGLRRAGLDPRAERKKMRKRSFDPSWDNYRAFSAANKAIRAMDTRHV